MNSLGFDTSPEATRIVVAMSGGVDSSVTAALLKREGYQVIGITLQLYDDGEAIRRKGACCAGQDIHDARRVAERLDIPHYVLDYESRFRQAVMEDFADTYLAGATPIPCVRCNQRVKFHDLLHTARELGAAALATGHYVQRVQGPHGAELRQAADPQRDQSYFLFATTAEQLDFLRFPLGRLQKQEVRVLAGDMGLEVAEKPDSQDICFVPNGRYAQVIERLRPGAAEPGEIVDIAGRVVGAHGGIVNYTIGQRRGLGGGNGEPLYVVKLDSATRRVVVGPKQALLCRAFMLRELNWLAPEPITSDGIVASVKVRSTRPPVPARISRSPEGVLVELLQPEDGVAPGQAGVIYEGSRVLGGGWIAATEALRAA